MESCTREHIVMLPFMAQGHLIPFLALANRIHTTFGFTVTIATTPLNARYLRAAVATHAAGPSHIHISELEFDAPRHGLPPNTENTESLPLHLIVNLFHSSTSLETPFRALVQQISSSDGKPPLCIISDIFTGWANAVAASCCTVNVTFTTCGTYDTAAYVSLWQHLPHKHKDTEIDPYFNLPGFPNSCNFHVTHLHRFMRATNGTDPWSRFFQPQLGSSLDSFVWLCNTAEEMEPLGLDILKRYTNHPVWSIDPLIPRGMTSPGVIGQHTGREPGMSTEICLWWLDSHL
ncbi:UDP-glycosyltransferase 92A1 [Striga hermonthica]|uniref:UDP-glycosyltransferase 92A1 n=1 Tax=Striga hermonthica TaxID=68872 RepID=A0A9N7R0K3_STRHE|nr:UDP-glycosyltransferase 92A1 [Striga hermonthica]